MFKFLLLISLTGSALASPFVQSIAKQEIILHGKNAYQVRCAGCHGDKGDGKGPAAAFLNPAPRDFTSGIFKFRSSGIGTLPNDHDLMQTLSKGVSGTSMPSFADVPEQERFAIVQYVKTFSKSWEDPANYGPVVQGTPFPEEDFRDYKKFIARAERGRKLFIESCVLCHGNNGVGDGEGATDLTDDWNQPIRPANLTNLTIKAGKSVNDIYKTLLVGVNGTPMSSYKDVYTDDQLWDLSAWVLYLRGLHHDVYDLNNPPLSLIQPHEVQN
ncbi:MAG: c-type cytochrome [Bacteriovoracia bacterium]